jgi:hypothetical protein
VEHSTTISLYCTPEWWDRHYHALRPRPERANQAALEAVYLDRQRFLFEQFGDFGMGAQAPQLGQGQIATVIRYGFDLVPVLLGTRVDIADAWGFYPQFRSLDMCGGLRPVDIAAHPEGEWILREKERLASLYGGCSHGIDIGSVTNNAFRILGQDVYTELLAEPERLSALFEVILETMQRLFAFLVRHFGGMDPVPLSNCNVSLMGPQTYAERVLAFDARQARFAERLSGAPPRAAVHHCDVPADPFLDAYARLPGVASLQASFASDVAAARARLPGSRFSALVSPSSLNGDLDGLRKALHLALAGGAEDFAVWNVDADTAPARLRAVFAMLRETARMNGRPACFSVMPLCWEELEWAHGRYQPQ